MRKRGLVLAAALVLTVGMGVTTAFAAAPARNALDENRDGICDYAGERICVCERQNADDACCEMQNRFGRRGGWGRVR